MTVTGQGLGTHLPWGASLRPFEAGDLVVTDIGLGYHGYVSDFARTFSIERVRDDVKDADMNEGCQVTLGLATPQVLG